MKRLLVTIAFLLNPFITGPLIATHAEELGPLQPGQKIVTLDTRRGVTIRFLLTMPNAEPKGSIIMFPGGRGKLVSRSGKIRWGFIGTDGAKWFAEQGFISVLVDAPSDQERESLSDKFKLSKAYTKDIKNVIEFVSKNSPKPIFLMGHSRGAISAAHVGAVLNDDRIGGVILTGSDGGRRRVSLATIRLKKITYPVLFVHHRDDGCFDIETVRKRSKRLKKSPKVNFIEVVGGNSPPDHDPCRGGKNPHTFLGKQKEVIKAVADWATGKPIPAQIGP